MQTARDSRVRGAAFVAAFVLVLQSFLSAWAAGAMPIGPRQDAFGNPLCVTSDGHGAAGPADKHSSLPNCCALGCNANSTAVAAPSLDAGLPVGIPDEADTPGRRSDVSRVDSPGHSPGSPRAPPLMS